VESVGLPILKINDSAFLKVPRLSSSMTPVWSHIDNKITSTLQHRIHSTFGGDFNLVKLALIAKIKTSG